jgi:amidohydrolase
MQRAKWAALVAVACVLLAAPAVFGQEQQKEMLQRIDALRPQLLEISEWLYKNPEPGHQETKAVEKITGFLKTNGWAVETGLNALPEKWQTILDKSWKVKTLPTYFKATYPGQTSGPTIAFLVEYDALRGPGGVAFHGCQHNMQGPVGIGAATALAEHLKRNKLPGRVVVYGTPAEEIPPPVKAIMFDAGVFKGVDAAIMFHGGDKTTYKLAGSSGMALDAYDFVFKGKTSHASSAPWEGRSALDAVILMFNAIDALREHSDPGMRMHGVITDGGAAPNVVPERAATSWMIRNFKRSLVDSQVLKVMDIAKGAALMTGTTVESSFQGRYDNSINVGAMERVSYQYAKALGAQDPKEPDPFPPQTGASTDFGTVSYNIPSITVAVKSAPEGTPGHSKELCDASQSDLGKNALIIAAKVQASLAYDLITKPALLEQVKKEHAELRIQK